jgi:hypothetical protein
MQIIGKGVADRRKLDPPAASLLNDIDAIVATLRNRQNRLVMTRRQLVESALCLSCLVIDREPVLAVGADFIVDGQIEHGAIFAVADPDFMRRDEIFFRWIEPVEQASPKPLQPAPRNPVSTPAAFQIGR